MWPIYFYRTNNFKSPLPYRWIGCNTHLYGLLLLAVITPQGLPWNRYTVGEYEHENLYRIANLMKHCNKQKWEF